MEASILWLTSETVEVKANVSAVVDVPRIGFSVGVLLSGKNVLDVKRLVVSQRLLLLAPSDSYSAVLYSRMLGSCWGVTGRIYPNKDNCKPHHYEPKTKRILCDLTAINVKEGR